jgi:voltage-gated potassium channel
VRSLSVLAVVVACGTLGFMLTEQHWSVWQAFYFTLITITTVGYGDLGISESGQRFAAVLLLCGIGTATWTLTTVVQYAVSYQFDWKKRMTRSLSRVSNHIVVCGFGRIGQTICRELSAAAIEFIVVEREEAVAAEAVARGYLVVHGDSTDEANLRTAGLERARGLVCAVESDAENVFIALTAREMNPDAMIASRANTESGARRIEQAGATLVVSPFLSAGEDIARAISRPHLAEFLRKSNRHDSEFSLSEVAIGRGSSLAGESLQSYGQREKSIAFIAIKRHGGETIFRPGGNVQFEADDVIIAAGVPDALSRMALAARC